MLNLYSAPIARESGALVDIILKCCNELYSRVERSYDKSPSVDLFVCLLTLVTFLNALRTV